MKTTLLGGPLDCREIELPDRLFQHGTPIAIPYMPPGRAKVEWLPDDAEIPMNEYGDIPRPEFSQATYRFHGPTGRFLYQAAP
jgi:hypothetical protein